MSAGGARKQKQKCEAVSRRARIEAHRVLYHSTSGLRIIKKKRS
jgi:hypothetical protein